MLWLFVLFFVPPVIAADVAFSQAYLPFYGPLFLSIFCLGAFGMRNIRRGLWTALYICGIFYLQQLHILQWWQILLSAILILGVEYLLTHR